ncbi:PEP-CTERM sorting domain-containing protein [Photobacterium swingsii]|uniref:PEP-CTERM sorting domain-containing protein n=1 Tax=Photobacterium swingsii TaxID=680026 RepID=UPI00354D0A8D
MKKLVLASALLGFTLNAQATTVIFDDFDIGHGPLNIGAGGAQSQDARLTNPAVILGGERDIRLTVTTATGASTDALAEAGINPMGSQLSWSNSSGAVSWVEMVYDGTTNAHNAAGPYTTTQGNNIDTDGLGGIDLSTFTDFFFNVTANDDANDFDYYFSVYDTSGTSATFNGTNMGNTGQVLLDLSNFAAVNLTQVGAISWGFKGDGDSIDIKIDSWGVVPEPSIMAIFGTGLLMFGAMGYRRKEKGESA